MSETTRTAAREAARLEWCQRMVPGIPVGHGHRGPIARLREDGLYEVGYSWSRWGAHHLSATVYERILGRGPTWAAAFTAAAKRLATSAARGLRARERRAGE